VTKKGALKAISGILGLVVVMPIWYYLLYQLLVAAQASDLMWFLYWVYLPVGIVVAVLGKIVESAE